MFQYNTPANECWSLGIHWVCTCTGVHVCSVLVDRYSVAHGYGFGSVVWHFLFILKLSVSCLFWAITSCLCIFLGWLFTPVLMCLTWVQLSRPFCPTLLYVLSAAFDMINSILIHRRRQWVDVSGREAVRSTAGSCVQEAARSTSNEDRCSLTG